MDPDDPRTPAKPNIDRVIDSVIDRAKDSVMDRVKDSAKESANDSAKVDWPKVIVHADMDAFYAAVEQLDHPELRGKPILIGPNSQRGVVLTASYEARPYGVGSAMPVAQARQLCPQAIMVPPRFDRYQAVSAQVMRVFEDFSPHVEALSLDEAFLDMSGASHFFGTPYEIGQKLKQAVFDATQLNISVGVSGTKYVAKVASAHDKPNGLTVVPPKQAQRWLAPLPVNRLWGVGKKTTPRLQALGLHTIGDIAAMDPNLLRKKLGSAGMHFYQLAHAQDPRRVSRGRKAKSIGSDRTLSEDITAKADIELHLRRSAERIARRVRAKSLKAKGVRVRLKTSNFEMLTRQRTLSAPSATAAEFFATAVQLLDEFDHEGPFRLVGMAVFDLSTTSEASQMDMFNDTGRSQQTRTLEKTMDELINKFGTQAVMRAKDMTAHGTVHRNGVNLDFLDHPQDED